MHKKAVLLVVFSIVVNLAMGFSDDNKVQVPSIINKHFNPNEIVSLELAPRFETLIRLPEPADEVVLGDPTRFKVENTERNIYVKPIIPGPAQTNLFILTKSGQLIVIFLRSQREGSVPHEKAAGTHPLGLVYVLSYVSPTRSFLIPVQPVSKAAVSVTEARATSTQPGVNHNHKPGEKPMGGLDKAPLLDSLFEEERFHPHAKFEGDTLKGVVIKVVEHDNLAYVLFRLKNNSDRVMQLLEPQVLLETSTRKGKIFRRTIWGSADILPSRGGRLEKKHMNPGEELNGIIAVEKPTALDSNQRISLAVSESLQADKPLRLVIGLGQIVLDPTR